MISGYQTQAGFDGVIIGFDSNPLMLQPAGWGASGDFWLWVAR